MDKCTHCGCKFVEDLDEWEELTEEDSDDLVVYPLLVAGDSNIDEYDLTAALDPGHLIEEELGHQIFLN